MKEWDDLSNITSNLAWTHPYHKSCPSPSVPVPTTILAYVVGTVQFTVFSNSFVPEEFWLEKKKIQLQCSICNFCVSKTFHFNEQLYESGCTFDYNWIVCYELYSIFQLTQFNRNKILTGICNMYIEHIT